MRATRCAKFAKSESETDFENVAELLRKSAYAKRCGRHPSAVTHWIATKKLTRPAIRSDGRINVELADRQLGFTLDKSLGRIPTQIPEPPSQPKASREPRKPPELTEAQRAQTQLLAARALSASVAAERARRELNAERGKYTLADEVYGVVGRLLADHINDVEASLADLANDLELDRNGLVTLRRWWRTRRERTAEAARNLRDTNPRFVEDLSA